MGKTGCGVITPTKGEVVHLQSYPGYTGDLNVSGTVLVEQTDTSVVLTGTIGGLEEDVRAGIHIHEGETRLPFALVSPTLTLLAPLRLYVR